MQWTVLFPIKGLPAAKSRLAAGSSGPAEHAGLVRAMWSDTLTAVLGAPGVRRVLFVVDAEATLADLPPVSPAAGQPALEAIVQRSPGLNGALVEADEVARSRWPGTARVAVVGDLPALTPQSLATALDAAQPYPRAFVADHTGSGTTLLMATADHALDPQFGPGSAGRHALQAVALEAAPGLRHDVDVPADLGLAARFGPATSAVLAARLEL